MPKAIRQQGVRVEDCPIGMKVCYQSCYWWERVRCTFPPGGYDNKGRRIHEQVNKDN